MQETIERLRRMVQQLGQTNAQANIVIAELQAIVAERDANIAVLNERLARLEPKAVEPQAG